MGEKFDKIPRGEASKFANIDPGDEVVISGIAGRFPNSNTVRELADNLFNKVDLISGDDRRWKIDHPEIPQRTGKIHNISKFDCHFFGVHFKQAHTMDPMCRMLMEHAFEAVVDAGVNPKHLRGTRTGVFMGSCFSESEKTWYYEKLQADGFGIIGCSRAMLANRISYYMDLHGPSFMVDSACSSSSFAFDHGYRAIRDGLCDAAIVGGCNLCLHPYMSLQFSRLGVLSPTGCCKSFDNSADGYVRSETVAVVFLQRAKDAKRIYATVVHTKINSDGYKEQSITFPSSTWQSILFREFYQECDIPPSSLDYLEAHGTGTKVGDPEEISAIDSIFCADRKSPLWIGSVKSNLGHTEPASGVCSIAKVLIAMETGLIPPNIHFTRPKEGVRALEEGRLRVVTEPTPWEGGFVGINSFGFGGANAHILLKSHTKEKVNNGAPKDDLPRLVPLSGRTEEAVTTLLDDVEGRPVDAEYVGLLHEVYLEETVGHLYRGYTIVGQKNAEKPVREIMHFPGAKRPLWFVFSGMGSQWPSMGASMMKFPVFREAIHKCDAALKPHGLDIIDIITNPNKEIFNSILHSFVGIAAVQIGLVDLLKSVDLVPDNVIGHSVGELGCAYADGCFSAEQMILSAYSRGKASLETELIYGSMAAVGMGYEQIKNICPADIEVACHNGPDSCTISGPAESMKKFIAKLQADKVFAREVPCGNIAYHSRYIAPAGPRLLSYLKKVIPSPKARSKKWMSTSVPKRHWSTPEAQYSSAEYFTNNLLGSVLFEETARTIPKNAITLEIAPHGLLQSILRTAVHPEVSNVSLMKRGHEDNAVAFLQGLGKLYNLGLQPSVSKLYPPVEFPVSRGTPMISPLIKWEHSADWYVMTYVMEDTISTAERIVNVTTEDETFEFMNGHVIDGRNLLPATGYLVLVWETVGMLRGQAFTELSVVFENVKFHRATTISKSALPLNVIIHRGTGNFEVCEKDMALVTGRITVVPNPTDHMIKCEFLPKIQDPEDMDAKDIYKELRLRGYQYNGGFKAIKSASRNGRRGHIKWHNWVSFMDNMLQMHVFHLDTRNLYVPTAIEKICIDTKKQHQMIREATANETPIAVNYYKEYNAIVAGGIEIRGVKASTISRRKPAGEPVLEEYKFVAHRDQAETTLYEAMTLCSNLAFENVPTLKVKTVELIDDRDSVTPEELIAPLVPKILSDIPLVQADSYLVAAPERFSGSELENVTMVDLKKLPSGFNALFAVGYDLLAKDRVENLKALQPLIRENGFLISRERKAYGKDYARHWGLDIILEKRVDKDTIVLLRRRDNVPKTTKVIRVDNHEFSWVEEVKSALSDVEKEYDKDFRLVIVGEKDFENGVMGFVNCLRREPGGELVRGVLIQDQDAPEFSLQSPLYQDQLRLDLAVNVLRNGKWGSYRHVLLPSVEIKPCTQVIGTQRVRGDLSSLCWVEGPIDLENNTQELIRVFYSSLNFRDVMLATGKLGTDITWLPRPQQEFALGFEMAGISMSGRRVMGLVLNRGLTNLSVSHNLMWEVPDEWTLEEAATVPCVYATVCVALYVKGNMKKGERVLIHAGTGGIGQAAINMALHEGCEVFTTVGTPEKRKFIRQTFPSIDDDHIGNSRDTSFEQMIMRRTSGEGVDIVLNSLAEEKLQASMRCLAFGGRFLEIGKFDLVMNNSLGMGVFLRDTAVHSVMVDRLILAPVEEQMKIKVLVDELLAKGAIKPLVRTVFEPKDLETAFRYMASGKHIGKVLLKMREENEPMFKPLPAHPRYNCQEGKSYVIFGGLGGFGVELADWLVLRGAQSIVLVSRTGIKNGYQKLRTELWKSYGVKVSIITGKDVTKEKDVESILRSAQQLGPIDAVFNLSVVLKDAICANQTAESFEESFQGKAWLTKILDKLTRRMCPKLRHFVVFSSVSCGRGNAGQTNYGMSNSVMERICEKRVQDGFPGLAIQWGAVGDVGLVADMMDDDRQLEIGGTLQQKITSCLDELNNFMFVDKPIVASMVVAEKRYGKGAGRNIVQSVADIIGLKDLKTISQVTTLAELGMDSMMAVEIKQTLEREFEVFLTPQDIRSLNFAKLVELDAAEAEKMAAEKDSANEQIRLDLFLRIIGNEDIYRKQFFEINRSDGISKDEIYLIAGIEGSGAIFLQQAGNLKSPAVCVQIKLDSDCHDSIPEMANVMFTNILARNKNMRTYTIVGYSYGAILALEIASKLEAAGLIVKVILIDGSPYQLKYLLEQTCITSEADIEHRLMHAIMNDFSPETAKTALEEVAKCSSWDEKLETFLKFMPELIEERLSTEVMKAIYTILYKRLVALLNYDVSSLTPINASITLLKPTQPTVAYSEEDYGLSKLTKGKVDVFYVVGNHLTMMEDKKITSALNDEPLEDEALFTASIMDYPQRRSDTTLPTRS